MKVIILAAGKGERLQEVVNDLPKPMISLQGKPILHSNIEWLKKNGFEDFYINLHHLPEVIKDYFGDGGRFGVNIKYSFEETLLGTAGAVKKIADTYWELDTDENFFVVYGDNFFDSRIDLSEIVEQHRRNNALITIGLHYKEDVTQSGVAVVDENMAVREFIEKPKDGEISSHLVNAGFYVVKREILEFIIPNKVCDFARDVFPLLLKKNEKFFSAVFNEGLSAIDTPEFFQKAMGQAR